MRSRERLIEVLRSVNPKLFPEEAMILRRAARAIAESMPHWLNGGWLKRTAETHSSPHIRELAAEALHYLTEDAKA